MTKINIATPWRGRSYDPRPFLSALPLPSSDASVARLQATTQTLVSVTQSAYSQQAPTVRRTSSLPLQLFDALAAFKTKTATLAAAHINSAERTRLFRQLDSLLDAENWDSSDVVATEASFTTLLRMVLFLDGRRPGLGIASTGNFIATWTEGNDRLTIECKAGDHVRWVLVQNLDGERESAAGETTVRRLPEVLGPYDPPKRWFPRATNQAAS